MSEADIQLLLTALGGVALLVALIVTRIRLHPLIALLVVSLAVGIAAGMDIGSIAGATVAGAGRTLGVVGIVIALGAMLGKILADSGVTEAIADSILQPVVRQQAALGHGLCGICRRHPDVFRGRSCRAAAADLQRGAQAGRKGHVQGLSLRSDRRSGDRGSGVVARHGAAAPGPADRDRHLEDERRADHGLRLHRRDPCRHPRRPSSMRGSLRRECRCVPTRRCSTSSRLPGANLPGAATAAATNAPIGIGVLAVLMPAILMLANTLGETLLPKELLGRQAHRVSWAIP